MKQSRNYDDSELNTYKVLLGQLTLKTLFKKTGKYNVLFDPTKGLTKSDYTSLLNYLLEKFIQDEAFEMCAKIRDRLNDVDIIKLDKFFIKSIPIKSCSTIGEIISLLKQAADEDKGMQQISKAASVKHMWSMLTANEKEYFSNEISDFFRWINTLNYERFMFYYDRLNDGKSLIPFGKYNSGLKEFDFNKIESFDIFDKDLNDILNTTNKDGTENVAISIVDDYITISCTNLQYLECVKQILSLSGVKDIDVYVKSNIYSLVYKRIDT